MVIWVWVTRARSLPSALVSRVCKRLERRLMCTGVASPVTTEPTGAPRRKLVLLSSVVVRVPVARFSTPPDRAQRIGERHIGPAVEDAAGGAEILPDGEPANHPGLLALEDLHPHHVGEGHARRCLWRICPLGVRSL